ncbi:cytochrome P450 [Phascolomyces articulosus]|uniref:Cytochrome P450 n=1 Tax=Phascolomyces articulosus TaxID=60185 RepID=A0AAD5PL24_9FUNG|nr:cytochrome P450 [Phascolomyces articulosus]
MDFFTLPPNVEPFTKNITDRILSINRHDIQNVGKVATATLAVYFVTSKLYSAFLGPLSSVPGPFQLKFYGFRYVPNIESPPGSTWEKLHMWQSKYGNVVRLGPSTIGIADKNMLKQILSTDDFPKGPAYQRTQVGGVNVGNADDRDFHKQRRRVISPAFSVKFVDSLERYMITSAGTLMKSVDQSIAQTQRNDGYGKVDMWILLKRFALEIIGESLFGGQTYRELENDSHTVNASTNGGMIGPLNYIANSPILGVLKLLLPFTGISEAYANSSQFRDKVILKRLQGGENARREDILQVLIDTQNERNPEDRLPIDAVVGETMLFWTIGTETISYVAGFAIIELLKNPQVFATLREELDNCFITSKKESLKNGGNTLFEHEQIKHLPYLNAVIDETLRIHSGATEGLERITDKDTVLGDRLFVPKGTILNCNMFYVQLNPDYWPEPTKFIPERWLPDSNIPADQEAFFPFSIGSRNCIAKQFAMQALRLAVANLIKFYDFEGIPEEINASNERSCFGAILGVRSNSFKVFMKRRQATPMKTT